jgi:hypothetical protein
MRRALRLLIGALLWALLSVVALAASTVLHLGLPIARRVATALLSDLVSREIRGGLAITALERLSPDEVVARGVVLFDADGRRIIEAQRLTLRPDLGAARHFKWRLASAKLDGASVRLFDDGSGLPTLLSTFDSPTPTVAPKTGAPPQPLHVVVDGIELSHVVLTGDLLGLHDLRVNELRAAGAMDIGREVYVRIDRAQGTMTQPFGFVADFDSLAGTISTVTNEGVALRATVHRNGEHASATIRYAAPTSRANAPQALGLEVHAERVSAATLQGLGFGWVPALGVPVSGRLTLQGPVDELALGAQLQTDAGPADVRGSISRAHGVSVWIESPGLQLAKLFTDYPRVTARGSLRIELAKGEEQPHLHAEIQPLLYDVIAVPGFALDAVIEDTGLRIDRIDARSRGARMTGRGRIEKSGAIALQLRASFPEIANDPNLARFFPEAHGRLDAELRVRTQQIGAAKLDFDGRIALSNLRYGMLSAKRLELRGSAHGDPERPLASIKVTGAELRIGDYLLGDPSLVLRGGPREYLADGQFSSAGRRTFNVNARVVADREGFVVEADPIELTVGEGSWRGVMQGLEIKSAQSVKLGLLRLASRSQRLEAHGILRFHGDDELDVLLQDFDLAALHALLGERLALEQGRADAHLQLEGDISDPVLRLQGALRGGAAKGASGINALYLVTYEAGNVETDADVDLGGRGAFRVNGKGRIDRSLSDPLQALRLGTYDLELSAQELSLALLPAAKRARVSGKLSGSLRFQGTLQSPDLQGSVELETLTAPGWSVLGVSATGGYGDGELNARFSVADQRGPLLTAGGEMQLDWHALMAEPELLSRTLMRGPWRLSGQTTARRLDAMPLPLAETAPYPIELATQFELQKAQGATSGSVIFSGNWQGAQLTSGCAAKMQVRAHGLLKLEHGVSRATLTLSSGVDRFAEVEIELDTPIDRWAEQGCIERPKTLRIGGRLQVPAMQRLPYLCEYGQGALNANIRIDNALSEQPSLSVGLDASFLPPVEITNRRGREPEQSCKADPIRVHFEAQADRANLTGKGRMQGCHGGATEIEGRLPVRWDQLRVLPTLRQDGALQGLLRFDGAQLKPLLSRIPGVLNADAIAFGQVSLSGTPKRIETNGQLNVNGGRLYLVATGQELTAISTRLAFRGDWAKLEHFQAQAGRGRLEAVGGIGFVGLVPERVRLALLATQLPIKREGVDTAWLTGAAAIDADISPERTRMAVELQQLEVRLPDTSNRTLQALEAHPEVTVTTAAPERRPKPYPIELSIKGRRKLSVRRNDFSAGIATELEVSYRDPDLNVGGYITFGSGEFEVFGKRFAISSGSLRFDGGTELNPDVLLVATQKTDVAGESPVSVSVTGTLAEPVVTFSSDVCPGEAGAITYLVSGKCAADDPDLAQESVDAQDAFTSGIVSGVLTLGVQHELSAFTPRIGVERTNLGAQRVKAGFSSESIVPKFMRKLVQRVYIEGGVYTPGNEPTAAEQSGGTTTSSLQFLIELYFPHNIVGSGRFAPDNWGVDALWEP